jgi:hypothetical protein
MAGGCAGVVPCNWLYAPIPIARLRSVTRRSVATVLAFLAFIGSAAAAEQGSAAARTNEVGPRASSWTPALVKIALLNAEGGVPVSVLCVEGTWPKGTPMTVFSAMDGTSRRSATGSHAWPVAAGSECSTVPGPLEGSSTKIAFVGSIPPEVRPAKVADVNGSERTAIEARARGVLPRDAPRSQCSPEPIDLEPRPSFVQRPFGANHPLVVVGFQAKVGGRGRTGPVVVVLPSGATVPWGYLTVPYAALFVDGRPYLWAAEVGTACGYRLDTLYAVELDGLRPVLQTQFLGD